VEAGSGRAAVGILGLLGAGAVAVVASGVLAYWLSGTTASRFWMWVAVVGFTAIAVALVARRGDGPFHTVVFALAVGALSATVAVRFWEPPSPLVPAVAEHHEALTAAANRILRVTPNQTCTTEVAPELAAVGSFTKVCVFGPGQQPTNVQVYDGDMVALQYSPSGGATGMDVCVRSMDDGWLVYDLASYWHRETACPRGFTFRGGG
jgi:hypothetical protein